MNQENAYRAMIEKGCLKINSNNSLYGNPFHDRKLFVTFAVPKTRVLNTGT